MNKKIALVLLSALTLAILSGCSSSKEPGDQPFGATDDGSLPQDGETIYDGTPLPSRVEGMDPSKADYQTLAKYAIYFGTDSFAIEAGERSKLQEIATWCTSNPDAKLVLAGHCDERGTTQYNLALGERRALAMRDYLVGLGVKKEALSTVSYGEEKPSVQGNGEAAWSKNRRAEAGILK